MLSNPHEIFARYESGEIERDELHALMALHARELIGEMEDDYRNPAAALIESLLARRAISRLVKRHGAIIIREVLVALAELRDFPPSCYLWNSAHPDVPLHCFLRMRREPVFRIASLESKGFEIVVSVEYGFAKKAGIRKESITFVRNATWKLVVQGRRDSD